MIEKIFFGETQTSQSTIKYHILLSATASIYLLFLFRKLS